MIKLKAIITTILILLVAIFAVQNIATVEIDFLIWSFNTPRSLLVILLLAAGFSLGLLASGFSTRKNKF